MQTERDFVCTVCYMLI